MTKIDRLAIPDVVEIVPKRFGDARGWFSETYSARTLAEAGLDLRFVQDNRSLSAERGTLRGLHFQKPPMAQDKLVTVLKGAVYDVAVDIRRGSPTFGRYVGVELTAEKGNQLLVPKGFAHGFMTLVPDTEVMYKVTEFYSKEDDAGIRWDDPDIAVQWPIAGIEPVLSEKDRATPKLSEIVSPFE